MSQRWSKSDLTVPKCEFRYSPRTGHCSPALRGCDDFHFAEPACGTAIPLPFPREALWLRQLARGDE